MRGARGSSWPTASTQIGIAAALWLLATALTWPVAFSFIDEVGYAGNARLLASGRLEVAPSDVGEWVTRDGQPIPKYPLAHSLLLAPLASQAPRALFGLSVLSLLALTALAGRSLERVGRDPRWALVFLVHPSFVLLARTAMADVLFALMSVGAFLALRQGVAGARRAALWLFALCALKATGPVIAAALLAGALAERVPWREARGGALGALIGPCAGALAGVGLALGLNLLAHGSLHYGYEYMRHPEPFFGLQYLGRSGVAHALSLIACPPLVIAGLWPYLRRRELGPVFVVAGLCGLMAVYFFVDRGRGPLESIVLSQRLILPALAFLLLGYVEVMAELLAKLGMSRGEPRPWTAALLAVPACAALAIGLAHQRQQADQAHALHAARERMAQVGQTELFVARAARKTALMHPGPVRALPRGPEGDGPRPVVVLCGTEESYRADRPPRSCELPGYRALRHFGPLVLLEAEAKRASEDAFSPPAPP